MDAEDAGFEQAVKEQDRGDPIGTACEPLACAR